jgi:DNA-binding CsgD family transcriptional regulator
MAFALATYAALVDHSNGEAAWRTVARDALALATTHGLVDVQLMALKQLTLVGGQSGDRDGRLTAILQMLALEPTTVRGRYLADIARFDLALENGGFAGARDHLREEVVRLRPSGPSRLLLRWLADLGFLELMLGERKLAVASAEEGVAMARDIGELDRECFCLVVLARARAESGDLDGASTAMAAAIALALALGSPLERMEVLRARGSIAAALGQPLEAAWFLGAAERAFDPTPVADPTDDLSSGAGRHWRAARRAADPVGWAQARRSGYNTAPDDAIERALQPLALDPTPAYTPRPRLRHGVLTPRELEIMMLVGEGRSDIEIAERLYISPKTASVHVANVKAKLGVSNRVEVAIQAREMGIVA